jgi:hypothetical protein
MIVPDGGRLADQADIVEYRDMLTIVRDRVQDLIKKGRTLIRSGRRGRRSTTTAAWSVRRVHRSGVP